MRQFETSLPAAIDRLSSAERDLVVALKVSGEADAEGLAERLELSLSATRSTLSVLRMAGLIRTRRGRQGAARRRLQYSLTDEGHGLFPAAHPRIVQALAHRVATMAPKLWNIFLDEEAGRIAGHVRRRTDRRQGADRLRELVRIYREGGFLAEFEGTEDPRPELRIYHCPFIAQARDDPRLCDREIGIIEAAGVDEVRRIAHQPSGDRYCAFVMRAVQESSRHDT